MFEVVFINFDKDYRIFALTKLSKEWLMGNQRLIEDFKRNQGEYYEPMKAAIKSFFMDYDGDVFLLKTSYLYSTEFKLVQIPLKDLEYFEELEDVIHQSSLAKSKWEKYFAE